MNDIEIDLNKLAKVVKITIVAEPEDQSPESCYSEPYHAEGVAAIRKDMEWNQWAWCCIRLTVEYRGVKADNYLGACSYESKEDFIKSNDYYPQMLKDALSELATDLVNITESTLLLTKSQSAAPDPKPHHCKVCDKYGCHDISHQSRNKELMSA